MLLLKQTTLIEVPRERHGEADTCIPLHLEDAVKEVYTKLSIRTVDMGVLVLTVTAASTSLSCGFLL